MTVTGWKAASLASGTPITSLRRLVLSGDLAASKTAEGSYTFRLADLLKLKAARNGSRSTPKPVATSAQVHVAPVAPSPAPTTLTIAPWLLQAAAARGVARPAAGPDNDDGDDGREDDAEHESTSTPLGTSRTTLGSSRWLTTRDDDLVPVVDRQTLRISYVRALQPGAQSPPPQSITPRPTPQPDASAYWRERHARVDAIAAMNAQQAAATGYPPDVVHAVWFAAGHAAWALDDATLGADAAYWHARRAGEQAAHAWMAWFATMSDRERQPNDLDQARARRAGRRFR